MDIETLRKWIAERDSYSTLETVDVHTGERTALKKFDYVIEAPNWTQDGKSGLQQPSKYVHLRNSDRRDQENRHRTSD